MTKKQQNGLWQSRPTQIHHHFGSFNGKGRLSQSTRFLAGQKPLFLPSKSAWCQGGVPRTKPDPQYLGALIKWEIPQAVQKLYKAPPITGEANGTQWPRQT